MVYYEGAWEYSGGNGMQVAMDVTWSAVNSSSTSVTATVLFYTDNQYSYSDNQTLNIDNILGSNYSFNNNDGTSEVYRTTRYYTYNYSAGSYGVSPGNVVFGATISGAYNGVTPRVEATIAIPARPGGPPTVDTASATAGIRSASVSWTGSGDPGIYQYNVYRNNDGAQLIYQGTGTSVTDTGATLTPAYPIGNGVNLYYIIYAYNAAGNGYKLTNTVTTPSLPSAPTSLAADASTFGTVGLSWTASTGSGYTVTYTVARDGTTLGTTTSTSYNDTTVAPSTAYTYTVTPVTDVGTGTAASISTTSLGGIARIYNGTTNVTALPQIWNGTAWTNAQARVWDGTEWKYGS